MKFVISFFGSIIECANSSFGGLIPLSADFCNKLTWLPKLTLFIKQFLVQQNTLKWNSIIFISCKWHLIQHKHKRKDTKGTGLDDSFHCPCVTNQCLFPISWPLWSNWSLDGSINLSPNSVLFHCELSDSCNKIMLRLLSIFHLCCTCTSCLAITVGIIDTLAKPQLLLMVHT